MSAAVITPAVNSRSAARAWLRALELTAPIANNPLRTLPRVIQELAKERGEAPALLSGVSKDGLFIEELSCKSEPLVRRADRLQFQLGFMDAWMKSWIQPP